MDAKLLQTFIFVLFFPAFKCCCARGIENEEDSMTYAVRYCPPKGPGRDEVEFLVFNPENSLAFHFLNFLSGLRKLHSLGCETGQYGERTSIHSTTTISLTTSSHLRWLECLVTLSVVPNWNLDDGR
jgi:hypothetical protein